MRRRPLPTLGSAGAFTAQQHLGGLVGEIARQPGQTRWMPDNGMELCSAFDDVDLELDEWFPITNYSIYSSPPAANRRILWMPPNGAGSHPGQHGPKLCIPANTGRVIVRASCQLVASLGFVSYLSLPYNQGLTFDFDFCLVNVDENGRLLPVELFGETGEIEAFQSGELEGSTAPLSVPGITTFSPILSGQMLNTPEGLRLFGHTTNTVSGRWRGRGELTGHFLVGSEPLRLAIMVRPFVFYTTGVQAGTVNDVALYWTPVFNNMGGFTNRTSNETHIEYMPYTWARERCVCHEDVDVEEPPDPPSPPPCDLEVEPTSVPPASPPSYPVGTTFALSAGATNGEPPLSYAWATSDGQTSTDESPSFTFNERGAYTASVTVTDGNGCKVVGAVGPFEIADVGEGPGDIARLGTDFDTDSGTLAPVTDLFVTLLADREYEFEATLHLDMDSSGGASVALNGTCTAAHLIWVFMRADPTIARGVPPPVTALGTAEGFTGQMVSVVVIRGSIVTDDAGTLGIYFAQSVPDPGNPSSILAGSTWEVWEVNL